MVFYWRNYIATLPDISEVSHNWNFNWHLIWCVQSNWTSQIACYNSFRSNLIIKNFTVLSLKMSCFWQHFHLKNNIFLHLKATNWDVSFEPIHATIYEKQKQHTMMLMMIIEIMGSSLSLMTAKQWTVLIYKRNSKIEDWAKWKKSDLLKNKALKSD